MMDSDERKHYKIRIRGKVQGVFFRATTNLKAQFLGINGYVMNLPDGSVYIEAEGTKKQLDNFMDWCKQGPSGARVAEVNVTEDNLVGYTHFETRR